MPTLKPIVRLSAQIRYVLSHLSFLDAAGEAVTDPATNRPLKLSAAEATVFQCLLLHYDSGITKAELEAEFPDLTNPYDRTVDRLRRDKLEAKLELYGLLSKKNGAIHLRLPESPFAEPESVPEDAKQAAIGNVCALSAALMQQYADSVNCIDDTAEYVQPFMPMDFAGLIAEQADSIEALGKQAVAERGIDPTVYEIFFAQEVARASEKQEFTRVLQLIDLSPDCWRVFVNERMQVVGYWIFVALNPASYQRFSSGNVNEKELTMQDVRLLDMPGWYHGYLLLSGVIGAFRTPRVTSAVYQSWLSELERLADLGIFFTEIASMVSSFGGVSSLRNIGMTQCAEYKFGGKMFRYRMTEIDRIPFLMKHCPGLYEKYRKELQAHADLPHD